MRQNAAVMAAKYFTVDLFAGILFFPVWWYTLGLKRMILWLGRCARAANQYVGVTVWIRNLFVPMYGETSFGGRVISFFMRLVMIGARSFFWILWMLAVLVVFVVYLVILPVAIFGILFNVFL